MCVRVCMTRRSVFIIKHASICGMADYLAANFANVDLTVLLQESAAVFFHLVCLSRLGTNDYFFNVSREKEYKYAIDSTASLASDSKLASNLVLFLTLLVFGLPYMNVWLYWTSYLYPKEDPPADTRQKRSVTCFLVIALYFAATALAWLFIKAISSNRQGSVTWVVSTDLDDYPDAPLNTNYLTEFAEELVSVFTLLVGVYHLSNDPQFTKIGFMLKLTVLAAALFRAFPGTHLSPHFSLYLVLMKFTNWDSFLARCTGGFLGFGLSMIWKKDWSKGVYGYVAVPAGMPADTGGAPALAAEFDKVAMSRQVAGLKISFDGTRYF